MRCRSTDGDPGRDAAAIDLDGRGCVQWSSSREPGSPLHLEINEGRHHYEPMPETFVLAI